MLTEDRNRNRRSNYPIKLKEVGEPLLNDFRKTLSYFRKARRMAPPQPYEPNVRLLLERRAKTQSFGNNPRNETPNFEVLTDVIHHFRQKHAFLESDDDTLMAVWAWAMRILTYYVEKETVTQPRSPQRSNSTSVSPHTPPVGSEAREERSAPQPTPAPAQPQDPATPQPPPIPLKHLDVGVELTGNRKGELRVPSLGRGVRVELNLKGYALPKGKTVVGFLSREDAGGSLSGGFRGTLADIEIDGATLYLIVKPLKKA
ncbi:MAG: hypothetical protein OHK0015_41000 [Chloroflexi bacterium OHK40]